MVVDLYNAFNKNKMVHLSIIDGVIGGEGKGPFCPLKKESKVLIAGNDLLCTDLVATRLMGFNFTKIKYLEYLVKSNDINLDSIIVNSDFLNTNSFFENEDKYLNFKQPENWNITISNGKEVKNEEV